MPQHLIFLFTAVLLSGCGLFGGEEKEPGGPGIIIPGESMEGIKLGDSESKVLSLLGEPDLISLPTYGFYRSWVQYRYFTNSESVGSGLFVSFIKWTDTTRVVDMLAAASPYPGETPEGIRIGSTVEELIKAYGEPDQKNTNNENTILYQYCGKENIYQYTTIYVNAINKKVWAFNIGYYAPITDLTCRK